MSILSVIPVFGKIIDGVSDHFKEKKAMAKAVDERKDELKKLNLTAKIEGIKTASEADMGMDANANQRIAWADDVSFGVFLLPALLAFFPPALPHIISGFKALENMPTWYQYALGMMLVSVWGYRRLVSPIVLSITKAYLGKK